MNWDLRPWRPGSYDLIVADPPWLFKLRSDLGSLKSPQAHYTCVPTPEICKIPVQDLARPDCWLLLWTTAPKLPDGLDVMRAWGFSYKTRIIWRKMTINQKVQWGPGYIARTMEELVLIGTRGKPAKARAFPSCFDGLAREHSRKPDEFYALCERFAPDARRCDIFGRQSRPGWDVLGNEKRKFNGSADRVWQ